MKTLFTLLLLIICSASFAANRFWISAATSNWNNTANWSATSGGAGGATVPGAADVAIFDANGLGTCNVDVAVNVGGLTMNGFTGVVELNGNGFVVSSGNTTLASGSLIDTPNLGALSIPSAGTATFSGTTIGAQVFCNAGRIYLNGSTFNNVCNFTKTGAGNDAGQGGNTFNMDATIANTGSGYFMTANINPDVYAANAFVNNSGTNLIYFADNSAGNTIAGNLTVTNSGTATGWRVARQTGSTLVVSGNVTSTNSATVNNQANFANQGTLTVTGTFDYTNTSSGASSDFYLCNGANSSATIGGTATFTNSGTGATTQRCFVGEYGDITFNGQLDLINNSTATNSQIYLNRRVGSVNLYNENITIQSTAAGCDGISFGEVGGTSTLAANKTITLGVGGYVSGNLYARNFIQTGATAQALTLTGTAYFYLYDSNWGGDVDFTSPRIQTRGTTYNGTADINKTGASNDYSLGGNTFVGNATIRNTSSAILGMGNGTADDFQSDLTFSNNSTSNMYLAYSSAGNTVGGNLIVTNAGSSNSMIISSGVASTLAITGNVTLTNTTNDADHDIYIGNQGDVTITGDLTMTNTSSGASSDMFIASATDSQVQVDGTTTVVSNGTGLTTHRVFLGNQGDCIFNGVVDVTNSSGAANSSIYFNYSPNSNNQYNHNIILTVDDAACDGIRFGENNGVGTLAATRTVTIGGGGFISGDLRFRNFTQVGATAQALAPTGTTRMYQYDSNWGGDVVFSAPRFLTRGTTYNGTASLTKNGGISDDASHGGNHFLADATLINSGSEYFLMGNVVADTFATNLTVNNTGSNNFYLAHNSPGNIIGGNLTWAASAASLRNEACAGALSTLTVTGNTTVTNTSTGATNQLIFGNSGSIDFDGFLDINVTSGGTNSYVYLANATASTVTVDGAFTLAHNSTATGNTRAYLGSNGDVTYNGTFTIDHGTSANTAQIFCNNGATSVGTYNENIILSATNAAHDGIYFGSAGGSATLAAIKTVTVGVGGYVAGDLQFRNFTQVGPTAQAITCTGTARIRNYDSNWGGDVTFISPRLITRGTTYNGTSYLEKTSISNDQSAGGNTFVMDCQLVHSGTNQFLMGNGSPDVWSADLDVSCSGDGYFYLAYNSAGNTIAGTLDWVHSGASIQSSLSTAVASTLTVGGAATFTNTSSVASIIYIGQNGDISFGSTVDMTNSSTAGGTGQIRMAEGASSVAIVDGVTTVLNNGTATTSQVIFSNAGTTTLNNDINVTHSPAGANGYFYFANAVGSSVTVNGNMTFDQSGGTTTTRAYLSSQGSSTFNGTLDITNNSAATNSEVWCNYNAASVNQYNGNITVTSENANCDGVRFGQNGGSGTLAATYTLTVGGGGFVAGQLQTRNFTQVGATPQAWTLTGTALTYNYDSDWGGNVNFVSPRMITRGTTYNGTSYLEKTSITNDQSAGGNTFVGNCELQHTGANQFLMGNGSADVWQGNLIVDNLGTGDMYIGNNSAGNSIAGTLDWTHAGSAARSYLSSATASTVDVTGDATFVNTSDATSTMYIGNNGDVTFGGTVVATNTPSGAVTGQIRVAEGTNSSVTFNDDFTFDNNGSASNSNARIANNGTVDINGNFVGSNAGSGTNSYYYISVGTAATCTIDGTATFAQSGATTTTRSYLGYTGDVTFNSTLDVTNSASSNNSELYLNWNPTSNNIYNGNITVTSEHASCDGVRFGNNQGTGTLAAGSTVAVGGGGFIAGDLMFRNFTQLGGTAQNIVCTGTARIYQYTSTWNADLTCSAPRFFTRETTYEGVSNMTKTGASSDDSTGGNIYNDDVTFTNSGTGRLRLSASNTFPDDYNGNATFIKTGTGIVQPSYNNTDTYAGDISINSTTQMYFGQAGNGRVLMDGGAGDQDINDLGASPITLCRDFQVNKGAGEVNLNMPLELTVELDLDNGVVNTTTANLLYMRDNSTVSSVSDASHIDGPIEKIGNDVFIFPVGDSSLYRPIEMTNPTSGSARFRAEYFNEDPHPTYDHLSIAGTLDHISSCEYWTLDRIASTNNVSVTLSWDTPTSCGVVTPADLRVARWDGAVWQDEGNGGTTGSAVAGTVVSGGAVTNFSPFTLGTITNVNPLPVELVDFAATLNGDVVDLDWKTMSEIDNDYFEVERSIDGENWEYLTTVDGAGNSSTARDYMTIDPQPYAGKNYYRLKQVDFDLNFEYSDVAVVDVPFNNSGDLTVYPNPTTNLLYVTGDPSELESIQIYNALGQIISPTINMSNGQANVDLSSYEAGIYFIKTNFSMVRVIKQ